MSNTETLKQALKQLETSSPRSNTARLQDNFEAIDDALKKGVRREYIYGLLPQFNIHFGSIDAFSVAMSRLRKKKEHQPVRSNVQGDKPLPPYLEAQRKGLNHQHKPGTEKTAHGKHNPRALDRKTVNLGELMMAARDE